MVPTVMQMVLYRHTKADRRLEEIEEETDLSRDPTVEAAIKRYAVGSVDQTRKKNINETLASTRLALFLLAFECAQMGRGARQFSTFFFQEENEDLESQVDTGKQREAVLNEKLAERERIDQAVKRLEYYPIFTGKKKFFPRPVNAEGIHSDAFCKKA
eukprot:sb/3473019/